MNLVRLLLLVNCDLVLQRLVDYSEAHLNSAKFITKYSKILIIIIDNHFKIDFGHIIFAHITNMS